MNAERIHFGLLSGVAAIVLITNFSHLPACAMTTDSSPPRLSFIENHPNLNARAMKSEEQASEDLRKEILTLRTGDAKDKAYAAARLAAMGPKAEAAILALIETFPDNTPLQRWEGGRSVPTSPSLEARQAIIEIGDPAVDFLVAAMVDSNQHVSACALGTLRAIDPKWQKNESTINAVSEFIKALSDKDPETRRAAITVLSEIGDARAIDPLIATIEDLDWVVSGDAMKALGKMKASRAVEPIILRLNDKDANVREAAAYALADLQDKRAIAPLSNALKDKELGVRMAAEFALGEIGK
ncbi:MAG TPA: HEAT repeat domain-containing protein [Candidatus Hydrogenedentes bacterium]|nr:HEAT repeat domain-containing protein [Candidatus Hydrogenedentota bacterium]